MRMPQRRPAPVPQRGPPPCVPVWRGRAALGRPRVAERVVGGEGLERGCCGDAVVVERDGLGALGLGFRQRDLNRTVGPDANQAAVLDLKTLLDVQEMTNGLELEPFGGCGDAGVVERDGLGALGLGVRVSGSGLRVKD